MTQRSPSTRGAGRTAVTLSDVAESAGVSIATASFVLSGRAGNRSSGSPETKAKVRAAARELGYVPNRHAQAMRTGRGGGIVLALGTLGDPWGVQLARQVRSDALPHDLSTLILADERWVEYVSGASADAAFLTSVDWVDDGPDLVRRLVRSTNTGIIAFSTEMEPEGCDVIHSSALGAVAEAYQLLRSRHDRVRMLVTGVHDELTDLSDPPRGSRRLPFFAAVRAEGNLHPERELHATRPGRRDTYLDCLEWLSGPDRPEAVICQTGYQSVALHGAAQQLGVRVPEDLEIISIGDVPAESQLSGSISYYGVDRVFERISSIVVDRARDRSDRPGELHRFDWEFFPGDTTVKQG